MIRALSVRPISLVFVICAALLVCADGRQTAHADDASSEAVGLAIAEEARARAEGFGNFTARQTMLLRNKQGRESRRQLRIKILEVEGDGNKTIFVFDEPRDVKGTAFLIHSHRDGEDEQWLYLPALKRVKRISSSNRSGSFMGSEFAYEDLSTQEVEKFTHRYLRDEACGDLTCTVSERVPAETGSGYSRQLVWHDRDALRVWKVEYYDRKDAHLKTLRLANYERQLDRFWYAGEMTMVNHQTGRSTVMSWTDFRFRTDLDARDFTRTGLKRVR